MAGGIGGPFVELDIRPIYLKDLSLFGCTVLEPEVFSNMIEHIERGRISPVVAETFPLEQIADAQAAFMSKKRIGKIVLTLGAQDKAFWPCFLTRAQRPFVGNPVGRKRCLWVNLGSADDPAPMSAVGRKTDMIR